MKVIDSIPHYVTSGLQLQVCDLCKYLQLQRYTSATSVSSLMCAEFGDIFSDADIVQGRIRLKLL